VVPTFDLDLVVELNDAGDSLATVDAKLPLVI